MKRPALRRLKLNHGLSPSTPRFSAKECSAHGSEKGTPTPSTAVETDSRFSFANLSGRNLSLNIFKRSPRGRSPSPKEEEKDHSLPPKGYKTSLQRLQSNSRHLRTSDDMANFFYKDTDLCAYRQLHFVR